MKISRKTIIIAASILVVAGIALAMGHATKKNKTADTVNASIPTEPPLNVSIMLDLSDRLEMTGPNDNMPQWEKDTTLIAYIRNAFINRQVKKKFLTGDIIRVFCYPNPNIQGISHLQDSLTVDLSVGEGRKIDAIEKNKQTLLAMQRRWDNSLTSIYDAARKQKLWDGSDVWGFFERSIKSQCIKSGYRNILIVLTDGYLYHKQSWQNTAKGEYTGISQKSVDSQKSITPINVNLQELEVLFLEVNPKKFTDFGKIRSLLTEWCTGMGIEHVDVLCTDLPRNNNSALLSFLGF